MAKSKHIPIVLELAALPREQVGPFLLLGVDKLADKEQIEACWAQRVIWARKGQSKVPLEDVNWAREALMDQGKRCRADAASLNVDTTTGVLRRLAQRHAGKTPPSPGCAPLDVEKPLADYTPPAEIPDLRELRKSVVIPEVPQAFPAARPLLEQLLAEPLDPWNLDLPKDLLP
jgi:hypothetical protein